MSEQGPVSLRDKFDVNENYWGPFDIRSSATSFPLPTQPQAQTQNNAQPSFPSPRSAVSGNYVCTGVKVATQTGAARDHIASRCGETQGEMGRTGPEVIRAKGAQP